MQELGEGGGGEGGLGGVGGGVGVGERKQGNDQCNT